MFNKDTNSALIGHTGFVGSNLAKQFDFSELINSQTIDDAAGLHFDLLVSAAPSAVKWKANKFPEEDLEHVTSYMGKLGKIKAEKCIAISTCDVYEEPIGVNEDTATDSESETLHAYGKHRLLLEDFIRETFEDHLIVRLPALFGDGLKKNVIYDFMHNNQLENIHAGGSFQFYNLDHLWRDIKIALENNIKLLNITTEPVTVREIAKECFALDFTNETENKPASYDIKTKYDSLYGGENGYMYSKDTVLKDIKDFVEKSK